MDILPWLAGYKCGLGGSSLSMGQSLRSRAASCVPGNGPPQPSPRAIPRSIDRINKNSFQNDVGLTWVVAQFEETPHGVILWEFSPERSCAPLRNRGLAVMRFTQDASQAQHDFP